MINLICHSSGSECSSPKADYSLPPRVPQVEYEYFLQNLNIFLQNLKSLESRMETFPALSLCLSVETVAVKQTVRPPLFPPHHRLPLRRQVSLLITLTSLYFSFMFSLYIDCFFQALSRQPCPLPRAHTRVEDL